MSSIDSCPSGNGRGSDTWVRSWTHLGIDRRSPAYCRVTFDHPPRNAITPTTVMEFAELVELVEQDPDLNVVVFDSANPDFYLGEHVAEQTLARPTALATGPAGTRAWPDLLARLSRLPVISIASIRGQALGAGSEFLLACDLRFASLENTALDAGEIESSADPGFARVSRVSLLAGRSRALEILLVGDDFDGPRAEQYGVVNRAILDAKLDGEVDRIASRLACVDHDAIARVKSFVGVAASNFSAH